MPKLPAITSRRIILALKRKGFLIDHVTGGHYIFFNPKTGKRATVPYHNKDLPKGTLISILKEAGLLKEDL